MKTFDEALAAVVLKTDNEDPETRQLVESRFDETRARYREVITDARSHEHVKNLLRWHFAGMAAGEHPETVMLNLFVCGVIVGMDMERQDIAL